MFSAMFTRVSNDLGARIKAATEAAIKATDDTTRPKGNSDERHIRYKSGQRGFKWKWLQSQLRDVCPHTGKGQNLKGTCLANGSLGGSWYVCAGHKG